MKTRFALALLLLATATFAQTTSSSSAAAVKVLLERPAGMVVAGGGVYSTCSTTALPTGSYAVTLSHPATGITPRVTANVSGTVAGSTQPGCPSTLSFTVPTAPPFVTGTAWEIQAFGAYTPSQNVVFFIR